MTKLGNFVFVKTRDFWANIVTIKNLATHRVDDFTVAVNHVVILNHVLAAIEVEALDTFLCLLEHLTNCAVTNWHVFVDAEALENERHAVTLEDAHEIVFARYEELSRTWITLTTTTTTELIIDAARIMTGSTNHNQATEFGNAWSELNIGTTTSHVGSQCDGTFFTSLGNNCSLTLIILGVQNLKRNALLRKVSRDTFVIFDGVGTDQDWLTFIMIIVNFLGDSFELSSFGAEDVVVFIDTDDWLVRRNLNYVE